MVLACTCLQCKVDFNHIWQLHAFIERGMMKTYLPVLSGVVFLDHVVHSLHSLHTNAHEKLM